MARRFARRINPYFVTVCSVFITVRFSGLSTAVGSALNGFLDLLGAVQTMRGYSTWNIIRAI